MVFSRIIGGGGGGIISITMKLELCGPKTLFSNKNLIGPSDKSPKGGTRTGSINEGRGPGMICAMSSNLFDQITRRSIPIVKLCRSKH